MAVNKEPIDRLFDWLRHLWFDGFLRDEVANRPEEDCAAPVEHIVITPISIPLRRTARSGVREEESIAAREEATGEVLVLP